LSTRIVTNPDNIVAIQKHTISAGFRAFSLDALSGFVTSGVKVYVAAGRQFPRVPGARHTRRAESAR